ncbi:hypothetical protein V6N13_020101 [Hibiscus sabdariffa]
MVVSNLVINALISDVFTPARGIRLDDPLSSYLFILCGEGLSSVLRINSRNGSAKETNSLRFTTVIHHGGFFLRKSGLIYTGEFVNYFDGCDVDRMSMFEIRDMVEMLGITYTMKVYWEVSINHFEVKLLANDADVLEMVSNLPMNHYVHVYLEDVASLANSASVEPETTVDEDDVNDTDHVEHVDRVDDSGNVEGIDEVRFDSDLDSEHSNSLHSLDRSDSDGRHRKYRYPEFNTTADISNPTLKVGLIFATKHVLKEAIKMYSIKNMVAVRLKRNDNRRIQIVCKEVVGLDADDCLYPLAFAVVDSECESAWTWFLDLLKNDLELNNSHRISFMTDRQKGLMKSVMELFPYSEHRTCVRHLYNNFKLAGDHKGKALKDQLWKAAKATYVKVFEVAMA